ncbi:cell adhesion molecule CEACAM2-like [Petromyzon marinus]|uniref:Carcinoembryonic antigen-related cell adhesion molecule 2-like n=1 Tax=Petromyzon marinus TaxID=7757 RepID=A0AAJ7XA90_PETMA|nr:carcinoembryonic antigen-related cell adhesion molecule 2-like [Petromyzon marinus]
MGSNPPPSPRHRRRPHPGVSLVIIVVVCAAFLGGGVEGRAVVRVASQALTVAVGSSALLNVSFSLQRPTGVGPPPGSGDPHAEVDVEWTFHSGGTEMRVAQRKQGITNLRTYDGRAQLYPLNGSLVLNSLTKKDGGVYTVHVTDTADGGKDRKQIRVTVLNPVWGVSLSPSPNPAASGAWAEGQNVSLSCSVSSGDEVSLAWSRDGDPALLSRRHLRFADNNATLAIDGLQADDAATYACVASNRVSRKEASFVVTVEGNGAARLGRGTPWSAGVIPLFILSCLLIVA